MCKLIINIKINLLRQTFLFAFSTPFPHKRFYTFGFEMPLTDDACGRRQGAEEL